MKGDFNFSQDSDEEAPAIKRDKFIEELGSNKYFEKDQLVDGTNQHVSEFIKRSETDQDNV